jgi:4-hydroxybenzoate polyprenyltransferase
MSIWLRAIRVHQWLKNLLLFLPVLAGHKFTDLYTIRCALLGFASFCLCASAVYLINDIVDLKSDRAHPRKRHRPFASGAIPVKQGVVVAPIFLVISMLMAAYLSWLFLGVLLLYFLLTCSYSFWLKNQVIVDVMLLAGLYTMRVLAGSAATAILPSFWLLAFSVFVFLSLALVKRYSELMLMRDLQKEGAAGRGYFVQDSVVLLSLGSAAAYSSVLVLALYINSPDMVDLYSSRWPLWLLLPPFLYWMTRIWLKAHRGELHEDPLVFAVTDKQSWGVAMTCGIALIAATMM